MTENYDQRLNELIEKEREIIKKMNMAIRAQANHQIIGQFEFLLEECKFAQQELRARKLNANSDKDDFGGYLSIG